MRGAADKAHHQRGVRSYGALSSPHSKSLMAIVNQMHQLQCRSLVCIVYPCTCDLHPTTATQPVHCHLTPITGVPDHCTPHLMAPGCITSEPQLLSCSGCTVNPWHHYAVVLAVYDSDYGTADCAVRHTHSSLQCLPAASDDQISIQQCHGDKQTPQA